MAECRRNVDAGQARNILEDEDRELHPDAKVAKVAVGKFDRKVRKPELLEVRSLLVDTFSTTWRLVVVS